MPSRYSRSIRAKLMLLFTVTASVAVLIACASLWIYQLLNYRAALLTQERATANLLADSSGPALLFNDAASANETLSTLRADTRIKLACLYDQRGGIVASFSPDREPIPCPAAKALESHFTSKELVLVEPIRVKGDIVGRLFLKVSLFEMYRLLLRLAGAGICVLFVTTLFALGLSFLLERLISGPILHLTAVAAQVSEESNYLLRAEHASADETGVLIGQFNQMMDRIQRRDAELQHARASLEEKVDERTRDLQNQIAVRKVIERDLKAAKLVAEQSNLAKSSFLANMSHELRTPLNAIIGYSEMLYEDAVELGVLRTVEDLDKILSSARHLLSLISDVLDFSKIEAGEMTIYPEFVMSSDALQDLVSTAEVLARVNRNQLILVEPIWQGAMYVDLLRFRQSMLNLISNACKFTEGGIISIGVEQRHIDNRAWILWSVRDTGIGISPEDCNRLFHTFTQIDSSVTRKHSGSGLGLAISRQLCEAMGGYITVESKLNHGSIFTIHILSGPSSSGLQDF